MSILINNLSLVIYKGGERNAWGVKAGTLLESLLLQKSMRIVKMFIQVVKMFIQIIISKKEENALRKRFL